MDANDQKLPQIQITPIQYKDDHPFKYNNFVCHLLLPHDSSGFSLLGCDDTPAGTREFIMRLSNPDSEDMYQETRIQNEFAILSLARDALFHINPPIVVRVLGWGSASCDYAGRMFQELMLGEPLAQAFEAMSLGRKKVILEQMALLLKALQDYPLPESIQRFGGADFDGGSAVVSEPMISVGAGPWDSLEMFCRDCLKAALAKADENPYLQGWKNDGVRKRIDAFIEKGLPVLFSTVPMKQEKSIINGDLVPENPLYDPATCRNTALLDYDFASILHPAYEFSQSFGSVFSSPLPTRAAPRNGTGMDWEVAQVWEEALQKIDVKRPSNIPDIEILANIDRLSDALLPWRLANEDSLDMDREENQRMVLNFLEEKTLKNLLGHLEFQSWMRSRVKGSYKRREVAPVEGVDTSNLLRKN